MELRSVAVTRPVSSDGQVSFITKNLEGFLIHNLILNLNNVYIKFGNRGSIRAVLILMGKPNFGRRIKIFIF